jgi:hypothetical protein
MLRFPNLEVWIYKKFNMLCSFARFTLALPIGLAVLAFAMGFAAEPVGGRR